MKRIVTLITTIAAASMLIAAGPDKLDRDADQYARAGAPTWSASVVLNSNVGTRIVRSSSGLGAPAAWFPFGSLLVVASSESGSCCFTQDPSVTTLGSQVTTAAVYVTDAGSGKPDGYGACFSLGTPGRRDVIVSQNAIDGAIGTRVGVCDFAAKVQTDGPVYPACENAADCTAAGVMGNSSCTASGVSTMVRKRSGAALICRGSGSGANLLTVTVEK